MAGPSGPSLKSLAKSERPRSSWAAVKRLVGYLTPHGRDLARGIAWLVASSVASAAQPALTGRLIDTALQAQRSGDGAGVLVVPVAALLALSIVGWWAQRAQILRLGEAGQKALFEVRRQIFEKLQELSITFFETSESGDLMSRLINDVEQIQSFLAQGFRRVISSGLALGATLAGMLLVEWRLAVVTLTVLPFMWGTTRLFGLVARRAFRRRQEAIGEVSATLAEELGGIKVAQAFDRTGRNRTEFTARNAANRDANVTAAAVSSAFSPVLGLISTTSTALVALAGGWLAVDGAITIGVVVAFFSYARQFFNSVSQLSSLYAETQAALAGGERIFDLLDRAIDVPESADARALGRLRGRIEFRDVRFSYATGDEVLRGIDLTVEPGETLAIVGETGAGKSTLVNLVPRFYDPTGGSVRVDGIDVRDVTLRSLRANLGMVLQEPFLFSGTVEENIRYGREDATAGEVREAAVAARATDFIEQLPDGFGTVLAERGQTLSTGQRQLISFARALLADPAILILDEATSSVDTRTEALIQQALSRVLADRTALVIAHRLSTVRDADRIVVLEAGAIVEEGTFERLLAADGAFARLYASQFAG